MNLCVSLRDDFIDVLKLYSNKKQIKVLQNTCIKIFMNYFYYNRSLKGLCKITNFRLDLRPTPPSTELGL